MSSFGLEYFQCLKSNLSTALRKYNLIISAPSFLSRREKCRCLRFIPDDDSYLDVLSCSWHSPILAPQPTQLTLLLVADMNSLAQCSPLVLSLEGREGGGASGYCF